MLMESYTIIDTIIIKLIKLIFYVKFIIKSFGLSRYAKKISKISNH